MVVDLGLEQVGNKLGSDCKLVAVVVVVVVVVEKPVELVFGA